ncbi:MAG TPA: oxidoreductase [Opitutaceae bacterium]
MQSNPASVWFITGISRGLGRELARAVLEAGDVVIGTTRDGATDLAGTSGRLHVLPLELTDREQVRRTIAAARALHGRLDVVVNNAGYGLLGAVEEARPGEIARVFEVNFLGAVHVMRAALPLLRAQRRGHLVNISSIAGLAPAAGSGIYAATKFALSGVSEVLAQELEPLGVRVTIVEPGAFRTDFLSAHSLRKTDGAIADYAATSGKTIAHLDGIAGRQPGDPVRGAQAILFAVKSERPPLHLLLGTDALRRARTKLHALSTEIDRWERVSAGTDFGASPKG